LYEQNPNFIWKPFINEISLEFNSFGLSLEVKDRSEVSGTVKKAFLKESSFGKVLKLKYERNRADTQTIIIKLEIDTRPPEGSNFENQIIEFPTPFTVISQKIPSLFAGKLHALLCRQYVKGRDWYDFIWYTTRKSTVNFELLANALHQQGPWKEELLHINKKWLIENLKKKVESINWKKAKGDVINFIKPREQDSIELWDSRFFLHFIKKLEEYL